MKKITLVSILLLLITGTTACSSLSPPPYENTYTAENRFAQDVKNFPAIHIASRAVPDNVIEKKNITYVRYGSRELQLDLYMPKELTESVVNNPAPGVVLVHCGGWR